MTSSTSTNTPLTSIYSEVKAVILDAINDDTKIVGKLFGYLESKAGVKRIYLLSGLLAFTAVYLVIGYGAQFLSNLIGFIYPAYKSISALETPDSRDDTKWLTYWVVFALFATFEYPIEFILRYIPFYFLAKCLFFAWCFMPGLDGASYIYKRVVRPFFLDVKEDIGDSIAKGSAKVIQGTIEGILKKE